jgi:DNA-binding NarL/FixJ family response regulator
MGAGHVDRPVSVTLVEDLDVVVEGVHGWIAADPDRRAVVVAAGESIEAALDGPGQTADVIVLDLDLRGHMMTHRIAQLSGDGHRVIVFSVHSEPEVVRTVLEAGACAFLDKWTEGNRFVDTVVAVAHDDPTMTPSMAGGLLHQLEGVHLSGREKEALKLLFQGRDYASIARRMMKDSGQPISRDTAKQYVDRARAKFAAVGKPCRSNFALLARSVELGLIRLDEIDDYRPFGPPSA